MPEQRAISFNKGSRAGWGMGYGIEAADFASICLWLANGDTDQTLAEITHRAEALERKWHGHFGTYQGDFASAFLMLADEEPHARRPGGWGTLRLADVLPLMLKRRDVYWKDTETYWSGEPEKSALRDALVSFVNAPSLARARSLFDTYRWRETKVLLYMEGVFRLNGPCKSYDSQKILRIDHSKNDVRSAEEGGESATKRACWTAVSQQIETIKSLHPGCLGPENPKLQIESLKWLEKLLEGLLGVLKLPLPNLYPTPEGRVRVEWTAINREIVVTFDLAALSADAMAIRVNSGELSELAVSFKKPGAESTLKSFLARHGEERREPNL